MICPFFFFFFLLLFLPAQNNDFIQETEAKKMVKVPLEKSAPLLELAGRAVMKHNIHVQDGSIPQHLKSVFCVLCTG